MKTQYLFTSTSNRTRKNMPAGFRLGSGATRIQATLNPGVGGGGELRQAWLRWMAQCMGYLLVACREPAVKSRGQGGVLHGHLPLVRLVNLSAK